MLIGTRIKQLRKERDMSLTGLSEKSGVQMATLSRIEHLKMVGSLESHLNIAKALGIELSELYRDVEKEQEKVELKKQSAVGEVFMHNEGSSFELLTNNVLVKKMMPTLLKIDPKGQTNIEQNREKSEKFVYVLEGDVEIRVGGKSFQLSRNSSLYFDASLPHQLVNIGKLTAKALCVLTPVEL
ncbi:MAG: hypothetical protein A2Z88_01040 [Omnitrophica WOR_2 bacterium GWA2_47_8]|nr:MAG: hypothetical protein A2Z88_01040 [Omnitrophica WOR_2 bacterium GWA2_47_8]